jgi:hypothetical protein
MTLRRVSKFSYNDNSFVNLTSGKTEVKPELAHESSDKEPFTLSNRSNLPKICVIGDFWVSRNLPFFILDNPKYRGKVSNEQGIS